MHPLLSLYTGMGQLLAWLFDLVGNYGVAIILLTVIVRVAMLPLAVKQAHMMQKARPQAERMKKIQPELKKIREKYKDDRQKQYEETQRLFKEHEINQFQALSGCLPLLLQMPIFIAMYRVLSACGKSVKRGQVCPPNLTGVKFLPRTSVLRSAIVGSSAATTFLGMRLQISPTQAWQQGGFGPALPYMFVVGLMGLTMWYQQKQSMRLQPPTDPQQAAMMKPMQYMWIIFVWFSLRFPSGLALYWVASNIWTIGQQYVLLKKFGPGADKPAATSPKLSIPSPSVGAAPTNGSEADVVPKVNGQSQGKPKGSGAKRSKKKKRGKGNGGYRAGSSR